MARRVPEEEALESSGAGGMVGADDQNGQPPRSYPDVSDRRARQGSSPLVRARCVACDRRRRTSGPGSRKVDPAGRRGPIQRSGSRGGTRGTRGRSGGGAPTSMTFPLSGPISTPRLPGSSPTPRSGTRLEAAVDAPHKSPGGRTCARMPPAPPPSPVSSKRSAVAAYASNPMLVPPGDAQEAGDCSEDSLAFWLRIICGPQRDGEAVDSLVRSQQQSTQSSRKCALCAAKTSPTDPPSSLPTQSAPSKVCGAECLAKLPVYLLPKVSSTKVVSLSGVQSPLSSQPLPTWAPQCSQTNKSGESRRPKRMKCASKSKALWHQSACVHCPTCGMCAHAIQAAQRCSCNLWPCTAAPPHAGDATPDVSAMEWTATTPPRPLRRRKARANAGGPAATYASTPIVSCAGSPNRLGANENMTSGMGGSLPLCLAHWCLPHPSLASSPSFVTEVARAHGSAIGDQTIMENLPSCYRGFAEKGDGAASTPAGCFGDGLTERARRKAWMRSLAKRRSWLCGRISAHALLARTVHRRICPKGQALLLKQEQQQTPGSKESQGEPSSVGRESPRREASSAPLLAREVGATTRRLTRDRRTPTSGSTGASSATAGGMKRRRVRCAFTSSPLPNISIHPGTSQLVSSFPPFSSPRYPYCASPVVVSSQSQPTAAPPPLSPSPQLSPLLSPQLSPTAVISQSPSKSGGTGRTANKRISFQRNSPTHGTLPYAGCSHCHHNGELSAMGVSQRLRPRNVIMVECTPRRVIVKSPTSDRVHFKDADSYQRPHPTRNVFRDSSPLPKLQREQSGLKDVDGSTGAVPRSILWQTGKRGGRNRGGESGPASHRGGECGLPSCSHSVRPTSPFSTSSAAVSAASAHLATIKHNTRLRKSVCRPCVQNDRQVFTTKQRSPVAEPPWGGTADRQISASMAASIVGSRRSYASEKSPVKMPPTASTPTSDNSASFQRPKSRVAKTPMSSEGRSARGSDFDRSDKPKRHVKIRSPLTSMRTRGTLMIARDCSPDSIAADSSKSSRRRFHRHHTASSKATSSPDSRADSKRSDSKRTGSKHSDSKHCDPKRSDPKRSDSKQSDPKRSDSKQSDPKRSDSKRSDSKRSQTNRPENNRSKTKLSDSIRSESKRESPKHSESKRFDHNGVDSKSKPVHTKRCESVDTVGEIEECIALADTKSLLQLFFHDEMYSSHTESDRSTSGKEPADPHASQQPHLIEMDEADRTDCIPDDTCGGSHLCTKNDSPAHAAVSSSLLTQSIRVSVEDDAGDNASLKESNQPPIQSVIRVSHHRKLHRAKKVAEEYIRSLINDYAAVSLTNSSDYTESNDISSISRTESNSFVEITMTDPLTPPKSKFHCCKISLFPTPAITSPNIINPICAPVDNSYTTPNTGSLPTSSTDLKTLPETRVNTEEIPLQENISFCIVSKGDEVRLPSDKSDKKSTASSVFLQHSFKDNANRSADLEKDDQIEFTSLVKNTTSSDLIPCEKTEQFTTNKSELEEEYPQTEEDKVPPNPEIEQLAAEEKALEETSLGITTNAMPPALVPDALLQLPQASRTTLVTTWKAYSSYTPPPSESEYESSVDTYSIVCSRSTPSITESGRDTWFTPSNSSSFSSSEAEEQKFHEMTPPASAHELVAKLSTEAVSASSLVPLDDHGVERLTPDVFESMDSFASSYKKYAPQEQESNSEGELKTAECSGTKITENESENVRRMIRLQTRGGSSPGYVFAVNNFCCSSDDSAEEMRPTQRQSVCLVLSSSTFSQASDTSTEATSTALSQIAEEETRFLLSPLMSTPHSPFPGMSERGRQGNRHVMNTDLVLALRQVNYIGSYSQHNGREGGRSVITEDVEEVGSNGGGIEGDACSRPPSRETRSSLAPSELSHGGRSSFTLLVYDSEDSHTDADANTTVDGDDITLLMLETDHRASRRARCMRGAGWAPDLVSDLPAPATDIQRQSARRGQARLRALLEEVQHLQAHKSPESALESDADLTVTAERIVSGSAKVKERILTLHKGHVLSEEVSSNGNEIFSECLEKIPSLEQTDIIGESMKKEYLPQKNALFTVNSLPSRFQVTKKSVPVLQYASLQDVTLMDCTATTPSTDRVGAGAEDGGSGDATLSSVPPKTMETWRVHGEGTVRVHPRAHSV